MSDETTRRRYFSAQRLTARRVAWIRGSAYAEEICHWWNVRRKARPCWSLNSRLVSLTEEKYELWLSALSLEPSRVVPTSVLRDAKAFVAGFAAGHTYGVVFQPPSQRRVTGLMAV